MTAPRTARNVVAGVKGFVARPLAERFWEHVRRGPECWEWTGATKSPNRGRAYGTIQVDGTTRRPASQVSWELFHGKPFPEGMHACHTCDNPPCVNPEHIFPGTRFDNMQDSLRKGRHNGGWHGTERARAALAVQPAESAE